MDSTFKRIRSKRVPMTLREEVLEFGRDLSLLRSQVLNLAVHHLASSSRGSDRRVIVTEKLVSEGLPPLNQNRRIV